MSRIQDLLLVATMAFLSSCVSQEQYRRAEAENKNLQAERDAIAGYVNGLRDENKRLSEDVQRLGKSAADASWIADQKAKLKEMMANLQGGAESLPKGVTMRSGPEGIVVEFQGEVLFASGKAQITPEGQGTLRQMLGTLNTGHYPLRVEGHTDTDPIVNSPWRTNLRLSGERSLAVAEFLIAEGVEPSRVGTAAYGEHRPKQSGNDAAAKQANRRVEILLLESNQ